MNLAVFGLFPCLLRAKQNEIKGLKETSKQGTNTRRQTEPYEPWIFKGVLKNLKMLVTSWNVQRRDIA